MHHDQFSAHIIRAPLEQVLTTFASYRRIRFVLKGDVKHDRISTSFRHLSLKESLEKLLLKYNYAIIQHPFDSSHATSEFPYLPEVVILSRNHSETPIDSEENWGITSSNTPPRPFSAQRFETSGRFHASDFGTEIPSPEIFEEVEEVLQDTDPESLALIKNLLNE